MASEDVPDCSDPEDGFSAFLQAVAAAPPPDRAFAPGSLVAHRFRVARPLFESPSGSVYLAGSEDGDVALLRRPGPARDHALDAAPWASEAPGRVRVIWQGAVDDEALVACVPVPVGTLQTWIDAGPHRWPEVSRRLAPVAVALAEAHAVGIAVGVDARDVWLGLDGQARLVPPADGAGPTPAGDRAALRRIIADALGGAETMPRALRGDRPGDPRPSMTLARALTRRIAVRWTWVGAGAVALSVVLGALALRSSPEPAAQTRAAVPATRGLTALERWSSAVAHVDAGDPRAFALVEALASEPGSGSQVALLEAELADDAMAWLASIDRAAGLGSTDAGIRLEVALAAGEAALFRGALLQAHWWLARAETETGAGVAGSLHSAQCLAWAVEAQRRAPTVDASAVRLKIERASAPSSRRVALQRVLAALLAAQGQPDQALAQYRVVLADPRANVARVRTDVSLAVTHLLAQRGDTEEASAQLGVALAGASTAMEHASIQLADAMLARLRGDAEAAERALRKAELWLRGQRGSLAGLDLRYERATWLLEASAFGEARVLLRETLERHDRLRGTDAQSRVPLERAYQRALEERAGLMTAAPPSRASASP